MVTTAGQDPATYELEAGEPVAEGVVRSIERQSGQSHDELPPLHSAINTDALEALFDHPSNAATITFSYIGYEISITDEREIVVRTDEAGDGE